MPAVIDNDVLINTLTQHLKGRSKSSVNFTFLPDSIRIQSSNDFIHDTMIKGEYSNDMIKEPFSVMINNALLLLSNTKGSTTIRKANEDVVVFEQKSITIPFSTTPDERIEIQFSNLEEQGKVSVRDFTSISQWFRNLINVSKSLDVGMPPVMVVSGKVYCMYSNTILICDVPLNIPDVEIPYNTFNNLSKSLDGSSVIVLIDKEKMLMLVQSSNDSLDTISYKKPNYDLVTSIEQKILEFKFLGECNISVIGGLELLFKCFPKETLTLSVYDDNTVGVMFSLANGQTVKAGIKNNSTIFNIVISTTQFDAVFKTFKNIVSVEIYTGSDIVCLKGSSNKTLILSGMSF